MYSFINRVRYSECDNHCDLTLVSMIDYLQDCAIFHSESVGLGVEHTQLVHQAWLLSAWQIEIIKLPRLGDIITTSTWCPSMSRRITSRNFSICAEDGTMLVRANSSWFMFDSTLGRPIVVPEENIAYVCDDEPLDMPPTPRRLPVTGPYIKAPAVTVEELHLDVNGHMNNAQYVGLAVNAIAAACEPDEIVVASNIKRICVQYRQQALLGNIVIPRIHRDGTSYTIDLVNPEGESYAVVLIEPRG